jgi:hypothetical protein
MQDLSGSERLSGYLGKFATARKGGLQASRVQRATIQAFFAAKTATRGAAVWQSFLFSRML